MKSMRSPSNRELHVLSSLVTAGVAGFLVFVITGLATGVEAVASQSSLADAVRIEAALAFKKKDPKTKQPQKRKKEKYKEPEGPKISRDETAEPPKPPEEKPPVKPDEIDPMSILQKNRKLQDDDASDTGSEIPPDEGAIFGDEWGSGDKNKGDPYVGGLRSRIQRTFEAKAPGFIEAGKTVWGCVKLDRDGKVADSDVPDDGRSELPVLNSAMEETLKNIPAMDKPVPEHLVKLLTEMGVCFRLTTK